VTLRAPAIGAPGRWRFVPAIAVLIGLTLHVYRARDSLRATFATWVNSADSLASTRDPMRTRGAHSLATFYGNLQNTIPPGASVLVMVDYSYLFDFKRNRIVHFDQPGAASPPPHLPFFQGPEAVAEYFLKVGIRYVAFIIGSSIEYTYPIWREHQSEVIPQGKRGAMYKIQSRYYLDTFDNFMALTRSRKVLSHSDDYWVLDLQTSIASDP
jgi:hypothetical protein